MNPVKHIIITIIVYFLINLFMAPIPFYFLVIAILLGLALDIIDHGLQIFIIDTPLSDDMRNKLCNRSKLVTPISLLKLYKEYYQRRKKEVEFMFIHNPVVIAISLLITVYTNNAILWLGLILHFICDVYENAKEGRLTRFIKSPIKMYQYFSKRVKNGQKA